jgi:hypothetical protein
MSFLHFVGEVRRGAGFILDNPFLLEYIDD